VKGAGSKTLDTKMGDHQYIKIYVMLFSLSYHAMLSQSHIYSLTSESYRAFHRFGQARFLVGGYVLGSSQFSVLPQLSPKTMLGLKEIKIDSKISNLLF